MPYIFIGYTPNTLIYVSPPPSCYTHCQHSARASWWARILVLTADLKRSCLTPTFLFSPEMSGTEAFRPQGRLPLDPFSIAPAGASLGSAGTGKEKVRRKTGWTVKEEDLKHVWTKHETAQGKVILVLGGEFFFSLRRLGAWLTDGCLRHLLSDIVFAYLEPTLKDLSPLLNSSLLSKSLLILATERPPSDLASFLQNHTLKGLDFLVLRVQPLPHPIPQQNHSILSRAELLARKWKQDRKLIFPDPEDERGRSKFRRNNRNTSDEAPIKAVQLSEIGGVFGRDFTVREEVGSNPMASASAFPSSGPSSNQTQSRSRAPSFKSASISKKIRGQRSFDAVINFVPSPGVYEEGQESVFMHNISSVSSASRAFLAPPSSGPGGSGDRRGRSLSRGSKGRSSSLDRIRNWMRSRSRSKTRNDQKSEKLISHNPESRSGTVSHGRQGRVSDSLATMGSRDKGLGVALTGPTDFRKEKGKAAEDNAREDSVKRIERGVLTSWSRTQLGQANLPSQIQNDSRSNLGTASSEGSKAYLIHVLPLSPPLPTTALLRTAFSQDRLSTHYSEQSSGSVISSAETEMPPLGASHSTSEELKDHGVSRAVPAAQKPESVESSTAIALNGSHNRNGSLDSKVLFSRSSSPGSTPTFRTVSGNETKNEIKKELPNSENPAPIGRLESTNQVSATESSYPNLDDNHLVLTSSSQENTSLSSPRSKTPLNRRASLISPAVEAAVKIATRHSHSLHVSNGRALSLTGPQKDRQLQRRSTAMQVASAAALAALEVSFTKAYENQLKRSRVSDMPIIGLQDAVDENGAGSVALEMNGPESDSDPDGHIIVHSRQSTLSTDIPEALMPHPHRQRSLVLRDSIFNPLDIEALFQRFDSGLDGTLTERPTPISLLPRPHARARTQSLDGPTRFSTKSDASSRVSDIISPITTALPMPPLSPTDPDFYYEKNNLVQELEQFLLSYSYADFSSSVVSLSALPKGAAKPAIISGGPADSKSPISVDAMDASNRLSRVDQTPTSFLLPQGLLGLSFKTTSSSFPDDLRLSFVDLILHGLLDPTSESLALYRDAMFVAKKMSPPGLHASGRRGVTLNELLALGALSGEEAGVAHSMPRAWVGGIADVDIENAIPEISHFNSGVPDSGSTTTTEGLPSRGAVAGSNTGELPTTPPIFSMPLLSAVSLHSQTVARSLRERGGSEPSSPHLDVVHLQNKVEDGWKQSVNESVDAREDDGELSAVESRQTHTTAVVPSVALDTVHSKPSLARTATAPAISSLHYSGALKRMYSFIPPGAALPVSPHLPNAYSTFPRHSVLLMSPTSLPQHQQNFTASTEARPQSDIDSENGGEDHREADDDMKDTDTEDEERCSELTSGTSISSNPNLIGAIPLPSVSSPLLGSPHSSISGSGTVTTSLIFSDETEILPSQVEPEVSVEVVSLSDSISIILDPPQPRTSLLLGPEGSESTPPESPSTPTGSQIQPDITERQKIASTFDSDNLASSSKRSVHSSPSGSSAPRSPSSPLIDGKRNSKIWLQRSLKPSGQGTPPESPSRGYFSGTAAPEGRRNSRVGDSIVDLPSSSVSDSPDTKGKLLNLPHLGIRRRSTVPKERPSSMYSDSENVDDTEAVPKKAKRLSRAISWMVTDSDDGPTYTLDVDLEEGQRSGRSSKSGSPVRSFFNSLAASASATSLLLNLSHKERRLSTSSSSIESGTFTVDGPATSGTGSTPIPDTHSPAPALVITPTPSPLLSILSLPLHNLSSRPKTPPGQALIISDSTPNSTCSTIPPSSVSVPQRLMVSTNASLARRHSNGAAPVGPRAPKRSGSMRTVTSAISLKTNSGESTQSQLLMSPISNRPLPVPVPVPQSELVHTDVGSVIKEDATENLITPFPAPSPNSNKDSESRPNTTSRPQSRSGTPTAFSPLRKLAIDEVPLRTRIPRAAIPVGKADRPTSVAGVGDIGTGSGSSKGKWRFWGNGTGNKRPVSMTVDLTREI
ncbi:uncharacterized protein C8R40DRAFT_1090197 [Lentinula edodes]|uniref:uncharacterized protein n=1 Tax=Lentinula edodes TaxID=5353 RepID=UPI001E8E7418|nr:uncharacterized protein C8R40DRAFT_1090197 [Lentinula edodes]KAH7878599.1 hypothetical protein C8R40DRAFT_1090197 [Lentinula edodes]